MRAGKWFDDPLTVTPSGNRQDYRKSWPHLVSDRRQCPRSPTPTAACMDITFIPNGIGPGKHRFDFFATNTAGTKWQKTVYATLQ